MDHFIDVVVLPDPEFGEAILVNAVYSKLHRALVTVGGGQIGVSFPKVGVTPGPKIRIHGCIAVLDQLQLTDWLRGLRDYTSVSAASLVPDNPKYVVVKRMQPKLSCSRIRRAVRRKSISLDDAQTLIGRRDESFAYPFVRLKSSSTGQDFPLFFQHSDEVETPVSGTFSSYGLSQGATVPWF